MMKPRVSIIILNWNKLEYLKQCILSIKENTDYPNYEVVILDNGSSEAGTKEYLSTLKHKNIINKKNIGFAKGNNMAAQIADGEFLLFVNNDIVVHKNWLAPLIKLFQENADCGIAGNKLLYPDGTIQHIGMMFDHKGVSQNIFKGYPADIPQANDILEREAVIGACMLIKKEVFTQAGGFDERYINGFEDIDLCLKVRALGFKVMYCPFSVATHFEKITTNSKGTHHKRKMSRYNKNYFLKKWVHRLYSYRLSKDLACLRPYNYYNFIRTDILNLIPGGGHFILDIGCAGGILGKTLKETNKASLVWGIEVNEVAAQEAKKNIDRVYVLDVEKDNLVFDESVRFDYIIFADILEHLKDPWNVLRKFRACLGEHGRIICSIPNIRYYKIIRDVVLDKWQYQQSGILDIDHLRFFTLATIKDLFGIAGYKIEKIKRNRKGDKILKLLNKVLFKKLDDFLTMQYVIVAVKR